MQFDLSSKVMVENSRTTSSFSSRLLAVLRRDSINVFIFDDLGQHAVDLVLKSDLELILHGHVKVMLDAEGLGQRISGVTFVNDNLLDAVLANVHFDIQLRVALINLLVHFVQLLVDQVFAVGRAFQHQLSGHIGMVRLKFIEWFFVDVQHPLALHLFKLVNSLRRVEGFAWVMITLVEPLGLLALTGRSAPGALSRRNRNLVGLLTIDEFSIGLLLFVSAHERRSSVVSLDLTGVLAQALDSLRGREAATISHELLEFFFLTRLHGSLDVGVDSVGLIVLERGIMGWVLARQHVRLGEVGVEAALVSILLVLGVLSRLVILLDGTTGLQVQVNIDVASGSARFVENVSLVGARVMGQLLLLLVRDLIAHFLKALVLFEVSARIKQNSDNVNFVTTLIMHLTLPVDDRGRSLRNLGHMRRLGTHALLVFLLIFLLM